ncbi:DUF6461 domain-containing protein [Streptomyces sp. Z26]|uniref:DUF6461 domain-containing protein n=1 Tax=Streptomyces sp. Z26 TaxID=2500177 RepID=UPI000EF14E4F|nr:DUF6461 domain-containing protein [Streptomyces sp. Z26]RLL66882.1 hypothetical protein D7M15_08425 [Streptomyces sp. Z26]
MTDDDSTGGATADDYADVFGGDDDFLESHCVTYVEGLTPDALLRELGAEPVRTGQPVVGIRQLRELTTRTWTPERDPNLVGAAGLGGWTVMVEYNGLAGTEPGLVASLSRGRTVVSHAANVAAPEPFHWARDGEIRTTLGEGPFDRGGTRPDALLEIMRQVGYGPLRAPDEEEYASFALAAFALAARLTGVRLHREWLRTTPFTCGIVPLPAPA